MRPVHVIVALFLLLLLGVGLLAFLGAEPGNDALVANADPGALERSTQHPPALSLPAAPSGRATAAPAQELHAEAVAEEPRPPGGWLLRLDVQGPIDVEPVQVTVRARPDGSPFAAPEEVVARCALNERALVELDELLAIGQPLAALVIEARHPRLHAETLSVALPAVSASNGTPPEAVAATLRMSTSTRVVGDALRSDGGAVACRVGVWRFVNGAPAGEILREVDTGVDGHFDVELPEASDYLLVAAHADLQPAWSRFSLTAGAVHDAGELVLQPGAALAGRFTIGGEVPARRVSFTLQSPAKGVHLHWDWMRMAPSPGSVVWTGAGIERASADQVADSEGRFDVQGLVPGEYAVHLHGFDEGHGRMNREPRAVTAPASGTIIELGWSRVAVRLELEDPSAPPEAAVLVLERPGREPERSDCFGGELSGHAEREFVFDADEPLAFQLEVPGLEPVRRELRAPAAGSRAEVRLPVAALDRSASLRLELRGEVPPDGTPFIVHVVSGDSPARIDGGGSHKLQLSGGELVLDELAPGPAHVLAYAGEWVGQRGTYLLDLRARVDLRRNQEASAILHLERGGRLRIGKRDGAGGWSAAGCQLRDAAGTPVDAIFVAYAPDGGGGASARGMLPDLAPSVVVPNLAPGSYVVRVAGEERAVVVRPGETTEVLFD